VRTIEISERACQRLLAEIAESGETAEDVSAASRRGVWEITKARREFLANA
jgi:hypothetical protein